MFKNVNAFILRLMAGLLFIPHFARCETQNEYNLFRRQCADLAQNAEKLQAITVAGKDNWFFLASELRHLGLGQFWGAAAPRVSRATKPEAADPLPVILDFNDQLKKIGVKLMVVPVPPKAVIYPEMLPGTNIWNETARLDTFLQEFYALLRSNDIAVLDLTDFFLQNKIQNKTGISPGPSQGPLYCRQDSHWSGNGCVLAAEKIAAVVRALIGGHEKETEKKFKSDWTTIEIKGDLRPAPGNKDIPRERLGVRKISRPGADEPVAPDVKSKIILLGDSHNLVFHSGEDMLFGGAGLPDQLAFELGAPVDLVAVRGSGATPARINLLRRARERKDYWTNKKCVIWCFSAREFTESDGWRKAPIK